MPPTASQTFLRELDKKLWTAADRLQTNLDAAVYKHADPRSGGLRTASSCSSKSANRSSPLPDTFTRDQHPDLSLSRQSAATTELAPNSLMALLLADGSLSSNPSGEAVIRRALIETDLVECMVAQPG